MARTCRPMLLAAVVTLLLTACGDDGGPEGLIDVAGGGADTAPDLDGDDAGFGATIDDGELRIGGTERPDWLPPWVLLPEGLEITLAFADDATGESAVTGFVAGGDAQVLYDEAVFMIQSGGYVVDQESQTVGQAFTADHSDGERTVRFAAIAIDAETVQWSMEFAAAADGNADAPAEDVSPTPAGSATLTIAVAGESWSVVGRCDLPMFDFQSDDGATNFSVVLDDAEYGSFGVGGVARTVDGGAVERWSVGNSMSVRSVERTADWIYFEGDMSHDDRLENAVVEVDCG